jgi:hypothetical protein
MVVALIALFVAFDGPATAARLVDGGSIRPNSITSRQVRNRTLGTQDLSKKAMTTLRATPTGSVGTKQLGAKSVDASKIVDGAVGSGAIADKTVGANDLADGAVGPVQLSMGAVMSSKLADGAVSSAAVADGGLQTRDIGDFHGAVSVDFKPFLPNSCQVAADIPPQPSAPGQGNVISDDAITVSPAAGWPDPIIVTGYPGAGNTLRIVACRIGSDPTKSPDVLDPTDTTFQYVAFDQP